MDKGSLTSVRLKIDWAEKHLDRIECLLGEIENGKCTITPEQNLDGPTVFRLSIDQGASSDLSLMIGDFLCNVRASLDHLVYQLTIWNGHRNTKTHFPICTKPSYFSTKENMDKLVGISPAHVALIEKLQPYVAGNPLKYLSILNNADKHRVIAVTKFIARDTQIFWRDAAGFPRKFQWFENLNVRDGDVLHSPMLTEDPELNTQAQATILVAFDYSDWGDGPLTEFLVYPTLYDMFKFVKETVIPSFEPLFAEGANGI
jgi:hypothetical protein